MKSDHRELLPGTGAGSDHDGVGLPVLLLSALTAMLATVAAIWALAATSAAWAMVCAIVVALSGAVALIAVVDRQMSDSDGATRPQDEAHADR